MTVEEARQIIKDIKEEREDMYSYFYKPTIEKFRMMHA